MAGATLEFDGVGALAVINEAAAATADPTQMLREMGEYLAFQALPRRFESQSAPDGTPWQALSPRYLRRKKKNQDKILVLNGYLRNGMRFQVDGGDLLVGTNMVYGAIHHFGGDIDIEARRSEVYFRQDQKTGEVGNRFVSRKRSNFSQEVSIGAYKITIPARPWLGTSDDDNHQLINIAMKYLMPGTWGGG